MADHIWIVRDPSGEIFGAGANYYSATREAHGEVTRERDAYLDDWEVAVGLLDEAREVAHEQTERAELAEAQLTAATQRAERGEKVIAAIKAIRLLPLTCDGENNAEVDAYHEGFAAAMEEVSDCMASLTAAPRMEGDADA